MSVYQTTISKHEGQLSKDDFASTPMIIDNQLPDSVLARSIADWRQYIPYKPSQIHEILTQGYPGSAIVSADLTKPGLAKFNVDSRELGLRSLIELRLFKAPMVTDTNISVGAANQDKGIGKIWLRNSVELAAAMGAHKFNFLATNENGAYTWARLGAHLDMHHHNFQRAQENGSVHYISRLNAVKDFIEPSVYHEAKALCRMVAPDDLVRLSRKFNHVMLPLTLAPINDAAKDSPFYEPLYNFYQEHPVYSRRPDGIAHAEIRMISACFKRAAEQGKEGLSLPRYLLSQSYWPGVIDFGNEAQMRDVGNNFGGWKTFRPVDARPEEKLIAAMA